MQHLKQSYWPIWQRWLFRFGAIYVLLYSVPFPIDQLPFMEWLGELSNAIWAPIVKFIGVHLLGIEQVIYTPSGSGDSTYDFVFLLSLLIVSLTITVVWSVLDRKRQAYATLFYYFYVYLRYYLAVVLMLYGFVKIFKTQFPSPSLIRLTEPLGDFSPMGLLWSFMGFSEPYNIFTGLSEALGGFLLFFRRTTSLGALLIIAVMGNVVLLNFSYDVPVKLFSLHLLGFALILVSLDFRRLWNVLVANKTALPAELPDPGLGTKGRRVLMALKGVFIAWVLFGNISDSLERQTEYGDKRPKPDMYGLYEVEHFVLNGDTVLPLTTEAERWQYLTIDWPGRISIRKMNRALQHYQSEQDSLENVFHWNHYGDTTLVFPIRFDRTDSTLLSLAGVLYDDTLSVQFRYRDPQEFLLINRGFHWVNESPYNQ